MKLKFLVRLNLLLLLLLFCVNVYAEYGDRKEALYAMQEAEISGTLVAYYIHECPECKKNTLDSKDYYMGKYPDLSNYPANLGDWVVTMFFCKKCNYLLIGESISPNSYGIKYPPKNFSITKSSTNKTIYRRIIFEGIF